MGVLDAMPSSNLKPESEDVELEGNKIYRTTYMFSATMPPCVERLARKCVFPFMTYIIVIYKISIYVCILFYFMLHIFIIIIIMTQV